MIRKIFLDLDDTLNNMTLPGLHEAGCAIGVWQFEAYKPEWGFDILHAANELHPDRKFTNHREFWRELDYRFWATLPMSVEIDLILDWCEHTVGRQNICVLSSVAPMVGNHVYGAKIDWVTRNLPSWMEKNVLLGCPKHFCASHDSLLIDDADHNIKAFRAAGGQAILVPRPWNVLWDTDTESHLKLCFEYMERIGQVDG
jgi:hypothetical protein